MTLAQARVWEKERRRQVLFELAVLGLCGVKPGDLEMRSKAASIAKQQGIGEFCGGTCLAECTATFGGALWRACLTCPD